MRSIDSQKVAVHLRGVALAVLALADELEQSPSDAETTASEITLKVRPDLADEVARVRAIKARNVSWRQLRRGSESLTCRDDHASHPPRKRALDRSLAKGIANDAGLTVEMLLFILDEAGLGHEG